MKKSIGKQTFNSFKTNVISNLNVITGGEEEDDDTGDKPKIKIPGHPNGED